MNTTPIAAVRILPNYLGGFQYVWEIDGAFDDPAPWTFVVQLAETAYGPWEDISPDLTNVIAWRDTGGKHLYGKTSLLWFRVRLKTKRNTYFSHPVQPYGDLPRREYLLAREIMRREALRARVLSGVECDLYIRSVLGPKCTFCVDPVTGDVRDDQCPHCFGTGRNPAYFGPHRMMLSFSPDVAHHKDNATDGTHEKKIFEALAIGNPILKRGDVIVDRERDKRYVVGIASVVSEIRRIACLQKVGCDEAPLSDPVYRIGQEDAGD